MVSGGQFDIRSEDKPIVRWRWAQNRNGWWITSPKKWGKYLSFPGHYMPVTVFPAEYEVFAANWYDGPA